MNATFEPKNIPTPVREALVDAAKVFNENGYTFQDGESFMNAAREVFLQALEDAQVDDLYRSFAKAEPR